MLLLDIGQFKLEGTSGDVWFNCLPKSGTALRLEQVVWGFIPFGLENLQKWRLDGDGTISCHCNGWLNHVFLPSVFREKRNKLVRVLLLVPGIACLFILKFC